MAYKGSSPWFCRNSSRREHFRWEFDAYFDAVTTEATEKEDFRAHRRVL
jgi:hypothetical protein